MLEPALEVLGGAIDALQAALSDYSASLCAREEAWAAVQGAKVTFCQRYVSPRPTLAHGADVFWREAGPTTP